MGEIVDAFAKWLAAYIFGDYAINTEVLVLHASAKFHASKHNIATFDISVFNAFKHMSNLYFFATRLSLVEQPSTMSRYIPPAFTSIRLRAHRRWFTSPYQPLTEIVSVVDIFHPRSPRGCQISFVSSPKCDFQVNGPAPAVDRSDSTAAAADSAAVASYYRRTDARCHEQIYT
ncbi:hypothetical protein Aperf_G00000113079 [Anoplocephala perfoliata]